MRLLAPILTLAATAALAAPASAAAAAAAGYAPGEVVVRYAAGVDRAERRAIQRATGTGRPEAFAPRARTLRIRPGSSVSETVRSLRRHPGVASAAPNWIARASGFIPNDPGASAQPGGWASLQWNFLPATGVNAPDAWEHLIRAGRPGASGVTVAVLDTGVAYADARSFRRSPDLAPSRLRRGYDFVDDDPFPDDHNGHGTHVASTVAESTDNGVGLTGLAYNARLMPVRVLNGQGEGFASDIARGIRYAARKGADVINLSFEFDDDAVTRESIPEIISALKYARRRGALVVGVSGNEGESQVAYPARSPLVLSVGATTEGGCVARYSNRGRHLDLVAPGGGRDAAVRDPRCRSKAPPGRGIFQVTFEGSVQRFGIPQDYFGTSMAAPHVSAAAAMVIAAGVLGPSPSPGRLERHLEATATDLGQRGPDVRYGSGRLDAARATAPLPPAAD